MSKALQNKADCCEHRGVFISSAQYTEICKVTNVPTLLFYCICWIAEHIKRELQHCNSNGSEQCL